MFNGGVFCINDCENPPQLYAVNKYIFIYNSLLIAAIRLVSIDASFTITYFNKCLKINKIHLFISLKDINH